MLEESLEGELLEESLKGGVSEENMKGFGRAKGERGVGREIRGSVIVRRGCSDRCWKRGLREGALEES